MGNMNNELYSYGRTEIAALLAKSGILQCCSFITHSGLSLSLAPPAPHPSLTHTPHDAHLPSTTALNHWYIENDILG